MIYTAADFNNQDLFKIYEGIINGAAPTIQTMILQKYSGISYADFQPNGGTSGSFNLAPALPIGAIPIAYKLLPVIGFAAPSLSTAEVTISDEALNNITTATDLITLGYGNTKGSTGSTGTQAPNIVQNIAPAVLTASLTISAATSNPTINIDQTPPLFNYNIGDHIQDPTDPMISAIIVSATDNGGGNWDLEINVTSGNWNAPGLTFGVEPALTDLGTIISYTGGGGAVTIDDLTDGTFDLWIWYVIAS